MTASFVRARRALPLPILLLIMVQTFSCSNSGNNNNENKPVFVGKPPVIFSEIYTANVDYEDEFGDNPGWVEFFNPADTTVNLRGYSLTNDANRILWTFGDVIVQPHSYLVVFLSRRDKPDLSPPSDSVNLIASAVGAWSWADSEGTPPGGSTAQQSFSRNTGLSGTLITVDNTPAFNWATAAIMLELLNWGKSSTIDLSKTNQILLRGNLSKDSKLEIRLAQEGIEDWQSWPTIITGTGIENDLYAINLPPSSDFPNLQKIYGLRFSNTANFYGTINFSFNSIVAQKRGGNVHVSFELNRSGGRLFLMDSLQQIRDSVAYPAEVRGLSFAKNFESGQWALSKPPTPNSANSNETYIGQAQPLATTSIPRSGYFETGLTFTLPPETERGVIRCDTSGVLPNESSPIRSGSTLNLTKTTIMRCAQFKSGTYPSEPVLRTYIIGERLPDLPVVSIAVNAKDMFDPITGLYMTGPNASSSYPYYGANYWADTELPIHVDFFESGARLAWSSPAGIKMFGNYSRGHPKKSVVIAFKNGYGEKNLKYSLFPEFPHLTRFKHFILRNNGNNFGIDYIRDMLMSSLTEGLGMEYQKGRAVIVYYNGEYFGIHNLRERTNVRYFETNYDVSQDVIDLVKANNEVSNGSDADYQNILRWLNSVTLNDENLRILEQRIDIDNFTNHFQSRIYYNDRDWPGNNMKRWRFNSPPSKWRWLLYDTDHGWGSFGKNHRPDLNALQFVTMPNGPSWPNPPHSTLILRKLLENENYKNAFINRFSLLIASYFEPARVQARINALMDPLANEIPLDQRRWNLNAGTMNAELTTIRNFGNNRPAQMQHEIRSFFGLGSPTAFTLSSKGNGKVLVHNLPVLNGNVTFNAYSAIPIAIKALPNPGATFSGWSDGVMEAERTITVQQVTALEATFM
ncbi:MAG: CotH kinase family protein [Fibromonadaceae bacterium]|jgi:hypothetical protein|nr:CotH kinase family protein [Fibromonadaceae bacterium]